MPDQLASRVGGKRDQKMNQEFTHTTSYTPSSEAKSSSTLLPYLLVLIAIVGLLQIRWSALLHETKWLALFTTGAAVSLSVFIFRIHQPQRYSGETSFAKDPAPHLYDAFLRAIRASLKPRVPRRRGL